jgi:asparagine synthase (glutamine-hydrolysing)
MFTITFDEPRYDELPAVKGFIGANPGRLSAARHCTGHCGRDSLSELPAMVRALEEPVSLGTLLPTDQVCGLASGYVKVVMTGEGADEIFAGYRKFLLEMAAEEYTRSDAAGRAGLETRYPELRSYLSVRDPDPVKRFIQSEALFTGEELDLLLGPGPWSGAFPRDAVPSLRPGMHPLDSAIALECRSRLPDYVILRLDKLSMRHSLETRTPFLDYRLAEFAAGLPPSLRIDLSRDQGKVICREGFAKHSILDPDTALRRKQPFTIPLADWLSVPEDLPDSLQEALLGSMIEDQGILDAGYARKLVDGIRAEETGPETLVSDADRLLSVLVFTLWYGEFFT